jgi:hypothetical protein
MTGEDTISILKNAMTILAYNNRAESIDDLSDDAKDLFIADMIAISVIDRHLIARTPIDGGNKSVNNLCPICRNMVRQTDNYCDVCGQRLRGKVENEISTIIPNILSVTMGVDDNGDVCPLKAYGGER